MADPNFSAVMSAARKRSLADPEKMARHLAAAGQNLRDFNARRDFDWSAFRKAWVARARAAKDAIVEAQRQAEAERARIEAMSPFERQMERVRNGARLIERPTFRRADYDFTLGGVSPEAM